MVASGTRASAAPAARRSVGLSAAKPDQGTRVLDRSAHTRSGAAEPRERRPRARCHSLRLRCWLRWLPLRSALGTACDAPVLRRSADDTPRLEPALRHASRPLTEKSRESP